MKFYTNYGGNDTQITDQEAMFLLSDTYGAGATNAFLRLAMEGAGSMVIREGLLKCKYERNESRGEEGIK